jgi:chemotaxis protein MotC
MNCRFLVTASVLALVHAAPVLAADVDARLRPAAATPALPIQAPASPGYAMGVEGIMDPQGAVLDQVITGQIPNPDAEKAVEGLQPHAPAAGAEHDAPEADHATSKVSAEAGAAPAEGSEHWATARSPMPFDIIRTIQFLQDQVSRGNGRAIQVQSMLLRRFGPVFLQADASVWSDARNRRAAVLFVLSGGPPDVLRRLMTSGVLDQTQEPVFKGALAYVQNDFPEATRILSGLDYTGMEPGLEAHLNLVIGQMLQKDNPKEAITHLGRARLLAPGGLIEEAALRMEVLLVDGLGDHAAADRLARQYFDRYADSSYSPNFEARFAAVYSSRGADDPAGAEATMLDVTARLADPNKRAIFLAVGRRAVVEGHLAFAKLVGEAVLATAEVPYDQQQRARLYIAAASVSTASADQLASDLAAIDRTKLFAEDAILLDATHSVLGGIDRTPELVATAADPAAESSPVMDRAQQLLNEVESDLGKAQK